MKTTSFRARAIACALLSTTAYCGMSAQPAAAQTAATAPFPVRGFSDANGVDLLTGELTLSSPEVLIGDRQNGLSFEREIRQTAYTDSLLGTISIKNSTSVYTVAIGANSEKFTQQTDGSFAPQEQRGSSLTSNGGDSYTYKTADGTVATFVQGGYWSFGNAQGPALSSIVYPSGKTLTFHYTIGNSIVGYNTPSDPYYVYGRRLQSVTSNTGYHIKLTYEITDLPFGANTTVWSHIVKVTGLNAAVDACSTSANDCTVSEPRPTLAISSIYSSGRDYTDSRGGTTHLTLDSNFQISGIRRPGSGADNVAIAYLNGRVSSLTADGVTTSYSYADAGNVRTTTVTRGSNPSSLFTFDLTKSQLLSSQDELGRLTQYEYDVSARPTKTTLPEGNSVSYTYDARGNITSTTLAPKPGSGLANIVTMAGYDTTCAAAAKCNKPNSTTDARGKMTLYTYDPAHGGVLTVEGPAPTMFAARPKLRLSYTLVSGVYQLTGTSACRGGTLCAGREGEVKTTLAYDARGNVVSASSGDGTGTLTATSAMTYDNVGNLMTVDGPLPGSADTVRFRYDAGRARIGTVSPDPDGAGPLKPRAERVTIDGRELVTKVERGTVNSQSDADWAGFASLQEVQTDYDSNYRPTVQRLVSGGATYALTQTSYDGLGRPECTAQRMNSAAFGSLPASACSLGTQGSYGPDRIAKTVYDAAGQVTQVRNGVGTADERAEVTSTYTSNGQVQTVADAENNKTTYVYDGHDRPSQTQYPSATKGAGTSNPADYEQSSYDANGNVTAFRNRAGQTIGFTYDPLNRLTLKDLPNAAVNEADVSYGYDLLGHLTSVSDTNGYQGTFSYDALGRQLTQGSNWYGTKSSAWDLAGRRTRLTHRDGFFVDYDYLVTGEVSRIRENGATSGVGVLATFGYDDLGRRTSLAYGNGTVASYGYDPVSRLTSLGQDLGGTAYDLALGFGYSPAGQIVSNSRSNDAYAYALAAGTVASAANGLNQLTSQSGASLGYDAKGNLVSDGTRTFSYTAENRLATAPGVNLGHDPLGRLYGTLSGVILDYDGTDVVLETDQPTGAQTYRRYVHGPGMDEPLVWYEGSGTSDRRFLHADERGSIVAVSDSSGTVTNVNSYDEYGKPASTNAGRFQYTGQKWIAEIGLYDYKARIYWPQGGRFLQTDPIGYGDGMNLYDAMHGDPVNLKDPSGTTIFTGTRIPNGQNGGICMSCSGGSIMFDNRNAAAERRDRTAAGAGAAQGSSSGLPAPTMGYGGPGWYQRIYHMSDGSLRFSDPYWRGDAGSLFDRSVILAANNSPSGRIYGERYTGTNRYRGALTDKSGGIVRALIDIDELALLNAALPLGMKNGITAPPAQWMRIDPKGGGVIFRHQSTGIQLRITGGQVHIDFPAGTRIGTGAFDFSEWGEVVHYGN